MHIDGDAIISFTIIKFERNYMKMSNIYTFKYTNVYTANERNFAINKIISLIFAEPKWTFTFHQIKQISIASNLKHTYYIMNAVY